MLLPMDVQVRADRPSSIPDMTDRPNVLFLFTDEHSFRGFGHLDEDGRGEPVETPTFDDLAASSAVFDQAYCQMPLCTPSRLTLLTGQEVQNAGAWGNGSTLLPDRPTMPATLREAGYATSLVGKMHLGGDRQFVGFEDRPYGDLTGANGHQPDPIRPLEANRGLELRSRTADAGLTEIPESLLQERRVVQESLSWLRRQEHSDPEQPWFLCASFSRPHFPLTAPDRFLDRYLPDGVTAPKIGREGDTADHPVTERIADGFRTGEISEAEARRARAAYFACIDFIDEIIGDFLALLDARGFLEDTVVVYAADHGELAGEHGLWWKHSWHEASTRVPLMIQTPAHRVGPRDACRLRTPVGLVDLFPTLCGLCDVDTPETLDGVDLSTSILDGTEPERGPVVCDNLVPRWGEGTEFRVVRDGRYKYVRFRGDSYQDLLFDVDSDPLETTNLARNATGEAADTVERLREFVADTLDFDAAAEQRRRDERRAERDHSLELSEGTDGNMYHLPDGRIVDGSHTLYRPEVIASDAESAFSDRPLDR